jgi:hypothetical protein
MRTHTTSVEIESAPEHTFAFVADGGKLPLWAIGFANAVEPDDDRWLVTLASGERLALRIDSDPTTGVVDYVMLPAPRQRGRVDPEELLFVHRVDALKHPASGSTSTSCAPAPT